MSEQIEVKGLADAINSALVPMRNQIEEMSQKDMADPVVVDKLNKWSDEVTGKMADLQAKQAKLEAAMNRPGGSDADGMDREMEAKHRDAFRAYVTGGSMPSEFKEGRMGVEVKAMSTDVNPDGGYLVRPELSDMVVTRIFETSPLRQVANVETIGSKSMDVLIDTDEASAEWEGEGSSATATTTPQLGRKTITAHILLNKLTLTASMIEDSYLNIEGWLGTKSAERFARKENSSFVNGDGVDKPRGFLTYAAWASAGVYEDNKIEQVNCGASGALGADEIIDLQYSLKEEYQGGATWGMKRATFGKVMQLKGNDQFYFGPVLLRDGQASMQLLGKPVVFMDDMEAVGNDNLCMVYADFSRAYTIVDRIGLQFLRDPYSAKPSVEIQARKRTGGDVTSYDAIKIGKTPS